MVMRSADFNRGRAVWLRERAKLTQPQLAELVSGYIGRTLHQTTISNYESGKREPSYEVAEAICKALGVAEAELITPRVAA